ncbi:unnamed protein product [Rangifer tarandus platyrhynchus]|uniref:Uncharacterized protein n=1 Tax=Rangifer tarandus platyrhynchus TaxID=3082113 RepID=A0ABN8ZFH5_RANTA|nr:unnamed protein product [Rangifer tarandus platyrhynchus]
MSLEDRAALLPPWSVTDQLADEALTVGQQAERWTGASVGHIELQDRLPTIRGPAVAAQVPRSCPRSPGLRRLCHHGDRSGLLKTKLEFQTSWRIIRKIAGNEFDSLDAEVFVDMVAELACVWKSPFLDYGISKQELGKLMKVPASQESLRSRDLTALKVQQRSRHVEIARLVLAPWASILGLGSLAELWGPFVCPSPDRQGSHSLVASWHHVGRSVLREARTRIQPLLARSRCFCAGQTSDPVHPGLVIHFLRTVRGRVAQSWAGSTSANALKKPWRRRPPGAPGPAVPRPSAAALKGWAAAPPGGRGGSGAALRHPGLERGSVPAPPPPPGERSSGRLECPRGRAVLLRAAIPGSRRWLRVLTPDLRLKASLCPDSRPGPRCFPPRVTGCDGGPVVLYAPAPPVLLPGPESRKAPSLHSLLLPRGPSCHPAPPDTQALGRRLCPYVHSPDRLSTCSDYTVLCLDGCPGKAGAFRMVALTWAWAFLCQEAFPALSVQKQAWLLSRPVLVAEHRGGRLGTVAMERKACWRLCTADLAEVLAYEVQRTLHQALPCFVQAAQHAFYLLVMLSEHCHDALYPPSVSEHGCQTVTDARAQRRETSQRHHRGVGPDCGGLIRTSLREATGRAGSLVWRGLAGQGKDSGAALVGAHWALCAPGPPVGL